MKPLKRLLTYLALAAALAALLALLAIAPPLQTWAARAALGSRPGVNGSLGSLSAAFGRVDVEDLRLEAHGAVLTLPSLQVDLPLLSTLWRRRVFARALVAKGWTLDLSHADGAQGPQAPSSGTAGAGTQPAGRAAAALAGVLSGLTLPFDASLDGAEVEGDLILAPRPGGTPIRLHVAATGGGLASGREGALDVDAAAAELEAPLREALAHGRLVVAMDTPRTVGRLAFTGEVTCKGLAPGSEATLSVAASAARRADGEAYTVELGHGDRRAAQALFELAGAGGRLAGTWRMDLRDTDVAPFLMSRELPVFSLAGDGSFESYAALSRVEVSGRLNAVASRMEALAPSLARLGTVAVGAELQSECRGRALRLDRLKVSVAGARPMLALEALQPFTLDLGSGEMAVADPGRDVLRGSLLGFPLALLSAPGDRVGFEGGEATGDFTVRATPGGFVFRMGAPLTASAVVLRGPASAPVGPMDLSASLSGDCSLHAWHARLSPVTVARGGRRVADLDLTASQALDEGQPVALAGTFTADLATLTAQQTGPGWIRGKSASGDFTASIGDAATLDANLALTGRAPGLAVTATVHAEAGPDGYVEFEAPVRVARGSGVSEIEAKGGLTFSPEGERIDGRFTSRDVALADLRLLLGPLAAADGSRGAGGTAAAARPAWGAWTGSVDVFFNVLRTPDGDYEDVGGRLALEPGALRLENGRASLPRKLRGKAEGVVTFNPAAAGSYSLKAKASAADIEAGAFFPKPPPGQDLPLEGRFSMTGAFSGSGATLGDLLGGTRGELSLSSSGGILRVLKTSVAEAIPQASTPLPDALGTVGSAVGALLGMKGNALESVKNPVSKAADAAINVTYSVSEIGFDRMNISAEVGVDGTVLIKALEMAAPEEELHGAGRITGVKGVPFAQEPLSLSLELGAKDHVAALLTTAGLLSDRKDEGGYRLLSQALHLGGTLEQVDVGEWHDLLVRAATGVAPGAKKG